MSRIRANPGHRASPLETKWIARDFWLLSPYWPHLEATLSWWTHHQHPYWTETNFRYSLCLPVHNSGHFRAKYPSTGADYQGCAFLSGDTGCQGWHYCSHYWELFITALAFENGSGPTVGLPGREEHSGCECPFQTLWASWMRRPLHTPLFQCHRPKASCHFRWETVLFCSMVLVPPV